MRQKTYPKASFLGSFFGFKPLLVISLGVLFLTQSSSAADDGDDDSKSPAKRGVKFEKEAYVDSQPIPEVVIPAGLLEETDPAPAEAEMDKIIQYLGYMLDEEFRPEIIEQLQKDGINIEGIDLQHFLLERAWSATTESVLQPYLEKLLKKNKSLQKKVKEFHKQAEVQRQEIELRRQENKGLLLKLTEEEEEHRKLLSKISEKEEKNEQLLLELKKQQEENRHSLSTQGEVEIKNDMLKKYLWISTCMVTCMATVFVVRLLRK